MSKQPLSYATPGVTDGPTDRPWMPMQLIAMSFLFGPASCGVLAGINYARLGKKSLQIPTAAIGIVVFLVEALLIIFVVPPQAMRMSAMAINIAAGAGFMLAQRPLFESWKAAHWRPQTAGERYKPNKVGLLFLVGLACVAAEIGVMLVLMLVGGKLN